MKRFIAFLCAAALMFSMSACTVESINRTEVLTPYPSSVLPDERRDAPELRVYFDGLFAAAGIYENSTAYIPLSPLLVRLGITAETSCENGYLTVSAAGLTLTAGRGSGYICANYRYHYTPEGFVFRDGEAYLPCELIDWVFGTECVYDDGKVDIDTSAMSLITGSRDYYDTHYTFEDMYWLSHIIYAEAMNEPLEGLIGVGNVVLNRVSHPLFPDSVYGVVYDTEYRIQFESTLNGALGDDIDEASLLAAYMCLEGCNTVGESIYFINPDKGSDAWLRAQKQFVVRYGRHDFYSEKES